MNGANYEIDGNTGLSEAVGPARGLVHGSMKLYLWVLRHRFERWRRRHAGAGFSSYYAFRVQQKLAAGKAHRTLGKNRWSVEEFRKQGAYPLALLVTRGLERHHTCLEYGCGSLRVGQHLIRFLHPGRYIGLDITDRFFLDGLELLEKGLVEEKRPRLAVVGSNLIAELAKQPPDFLLSIDVLQHVDPRELDEFLATLVQLTGPRTQAFLSFREWKETLQTAEKSWSHPAVTLAERIAHLAPDARLRLLRGERVGSRWDPSRKSILCFHRFLRPAPGQAQA